MENTCHIKFVLNDRGDFALGQALLLVEPVAPLDLSSRKWPTFSRISICPRIDRVLAYLEEVVEDHLYVGQVEVAGHHEAAGAPVVLAGDGCT